MGERGQLPPYKATGIGFSPQVVGLVVEAIYVLL